MLKLLLVSPDKKFLSGLLSALEKDDNVGLSWAESGESALNMLLDMTIDLVITDENLGDMTGLELAGRLVLLNPMINCAAISSLSQKSFHEASEGLGLIAQLPKPPAGRDAEKLLRDLKRIKESLA